MITAQSLCPPGQSLSAAEIRATLQQGLAGRCTGEKVLVLIPDHTRSLPLPELFRALVEVLADARQLDFMVALGTHPPLTEPELNRLVGVTAEERQTTLRRIGLLNHAWDDPAALVTLGAFEADEIRQLAGSAWHPSLPTTIPIRLNQAALHCDRLLILGPTFPHEVAGFSGGAKYVFPGISGPELIHASHWLGALATVVGTIGVQATPVRAMIEAATDRLATPIDLVALVVEGQAVSGMWIGDRRDAWRAAADRSAERHIRWCERPYQRVLSWAPPMYDELWTAAKAMYKLEPVVARGGEVVIYAPHLQTVSRVHGRYLDEVGYHCLPYFLDHWERYRHIPLGVLAHSTHVRGSRVMVAGVEQPHVRVTLASQVPAAECARLNLGYQDPAQIQPADWQDREAEGVLYVPKAGEILYRLRR